MMKFTYRTKMGLSFILVPHHLLHRPVSSISVVLWDQTKRILAIQIIFVLPFSHGQLIHSPDTHGQKR